MCGRYQFSADEYKEISQIVGEFQQWGLPCFRGRQQIINAHAETVTEKPMFRRSIAFQRCVIPATGFYEWDAVNANIYLSHFPAK